jgi:hypothetical protein
MNKDGTTAIKISDGKVPLQFADGRWRGFPGWPKYEPTARDPEAWSNWPDAGLCLVTGVVAGWDIDIKVSPEDSSPEAHAAKELISEIGRVVARKAGVPSVRNLPVRGRGNSTSCVLFVRPTEPMYKRVLTIFRPGASVTYKVEFLAQGQQVVVAGMHESGAQVRSSLPRFGLQGVPEITPEAVDEAFAEIAALAEDVGYEVGVKGGRPPKAATGPYKPDEAVTREIMRRRAEWVPYVLPCTPGKPDREWRVSSADLDRELEEDISIYPDGIYDYGTERSHSIASLICEFAAIDDHGEISFGGCPDYGRSGGEEFAVVGAKPRH